MELFTIVLTLFIFFPITFPFIILRFAIFCLSFYLNRKYSITLSVAKCGYVSFRTIRIRLPAADREVGQGESSDGSRRSSTSSCDCGKVRYIDEEREQKYLTITIDNLRISSSYLDSSCASILSICLNNVTLENPTDDRVVQTIKFKSFEFPFDRIRSDFLKHYSQNFNISICDIIIPSKNVLYKIERLNVSRKASEQNDHVLKSDQRRDSQQQAQQQRSLNLQFNRVIFSDLSIPEVELFSEMPEELDRQRIMFIEQLELTYSIGQQGGNGNKNLHLNLNGDCFLQCNIEFYLNFVRLIGDIKNLIRSLKTSRKSTTNINHTDQQAMTKPKTQQSIAESSLKKTLHLKLILTGRLKLGIEVAENQTVCLDTQTLDINASFPGSKTAQSDLVCMEFDNQPMLICSMVKVAHYPAPGVGSILDRQQNSCGYKLNDATNSLLNIELETATLLFPYKYNFAEVFNEKLMGCIKWLKVFHKRRNARDACNKEKPIDFDISMRINKCTFDIEDDLLETKLRTNYMLLEDEHHEQLKRDQTLQEKINELKRTNLMLASSIVDELNRALAKKNSDIYIQRSKQLYSSEARAVPLFSVTIEEADLKMIADSSWHRHYDIKSVIKSLNPESSIASSIEFSTLFCRIISSNFKSVECTLRDFNLPMLSMNDLTIKGMILGSEQVAQPRAKRSCEVYVGRQTSPYLVERSMTPLKIFHNLQLRCTTASYTHGPCWEPVLQQVSLAFEDIVSASSDPSPSLSWWDKMRLITHGQAKLNCNQLSVLLHASNDPYNQTELIEITLSRALLDYATGKIRAKGDFDVLLRTASKYDECRFIHIPNFDLNIQLEWNCLGNQHDHHTLMPCAPDKVPDYSSHHSHDSYRSFRSQSLNMYMNLETQFTSPTSSMNPENMPSMLFFGSTIRWLENQKFIFLEPSKLTRRGVLFQNTKPKKSSFSRVFKEIKLNISLSRFQILYWSSVSKRHGIHVVGGQFSHNSQHTLKLVSDFADGLKHRPKSDWQTTYMKSSLNNVEVWLYNLGFEDLDEFNEFNTLSNLKNRQYFISFSQVSYNKEATPAANKSTCDEHDNHSVNDIMSGAIGLAGNCSIESISENMNNVTEMQSTQSEKQVLPNHKLVVHDLKAAWTKDNRDVVVGIFDAFINSQQLKRNLSTEALKPIRTIEQASNSFSSSQHYHHHQLLHSQPSTNQNVTTGQQQAPSYRQHQRHPSTTSLINTSILASNNSTGSLSKNRAVSMLQKLIADSENNPNVYTEETHSGVASDSHLYGVEACQMDDVVDINCEITLVNSQVMLCGTETAGYVIVSAAQTEIRQATHLPVWKNRTLLSKTTWTGSLSCMQYYATVDDNTTRSSPGSSMATHSGYRTTFFINENDIQWLEPDNIENNPTRSNVYDNLTDYLVGSGHSVGGVVSPIVGKRAQDTIRCPSGYSDSGRISPATHSRNHHQANHNQIEPVQLQRIISRCNCLFYYASHTMGVPDALQHLIPPLPEDDMFIEPWDKEVGVDSFTLTHENLEISTNSQQYSMILDIINNLLLFVEPHKKTAFEKLERMRFRFQLSADEDQREPISELQDQVRKYVAYLKRLERERYLIYRASIDASIDASVDEPRRANAQQQLIQSISGCFGGIDRESTSDRDRSYRKSLSSLSEEISNVKEQLNMASEELAMMISCYKEIQLGAHKAQKQQQAAQASQRGGGTGAFFANVIRRNEISFQSARWRVTDYDGQLGLADIVLNNFLYSKVVKSDDSVEHTIELGHLHVSNLIPNQAYKDVLRPTELQANIPLDRQRALRIFCRELAPVAGIPVKEHLEINVVPFTIEVTLQFFQKMVKFFFPEREAAKEAKRSGNSLTSSGGGTGSSGGLESSGEHQLTRFGSKKRTLRDKEAASKNKQDQQDLLSIASNELTSSGNSCGGGSGGKGSTTPSSNPSNTIGLNSLRVPDDTLSMISTSTMNSQSTTVSSLNSATHHHHVQRRGEEIEKMRERAAKNHTFVYVKIPGIPIKISYKGKKQKSVTDLKNICLTLPTYEYHNLTWTWLDLLMAVKNDSKHTVIKQALKQKMKIRPSSLWSKASGNSSNNPQQSSSPSEVESNSSKDKGSGGGGGGSTPVTDEDKARLLLGQYAKKWRSEPESPHGERSATPNINDEK